MAGMIVEAVRTPVRVYYEDTDFSGRVYHASYVRFFERGRTEWLRAAGLAHRDLAALGMAFAVTRLEVDFHAPASIDDAIDVLTEVSGLRGAVVSFRQRLERERVVLATGVAEVVAIKHGRAARLPRQFLIALKSGAAAQSTPPIP